MRLRIGRRRRIERIEGQITRLREHAAALLEQEQATSDRLRELSGGALEDGGRIRRARRERAIRRAEDRLERLRADREQLVESEIRSIMLALQEQSKRTRERLDRELERLSPLEREWERLRAMFDALEETIETPALHALARHWQGDLEIPQFPVTERQGYIKPFPSRAILF